ncbi:MULTISPECIES: hypothetical protein [Chryseobacterium]|uniref:Small-conductance mechanosensitive channel n=1 Tax=Chryseobacterium camelliae TaxID=1265445 RepID=A0ABU0TLU5_9FLAO|nr:MULTISPECIES: hypothetical protein [Chryseobacterium]MDT3408120.1 small-conductance mechanosensitive channel [Pseudacidovorax intermedius]MDQ1098024.1 small-conductance mechanosensitive channel [Chryseobacterium camelliae]MDQ1101952.1 small-conductance mechanosensitive channel [Chryseobacterium sp. SORGH_AS_1048]MDR6085392.1 small-conductance mechanosensitive channel [Chryseobacterium sp. SORGH_AS_0909]MDR6129754.1 small-conductance mechanosensitive channel [Chryseobacterium sp. SORGH_AS_11
MKSLSITGIVLLAISALLFYLTTDFTVERITLSHVMGVMAGIGIGLIIGGMVGYVSKGSAVKAEEKRREYKQLQKEKEDLEKQAAELARREAEIQAEASYKNQNPQI